MAKERGRRPARAVIVTGASSGIGRAVVRRLAGDGFRVFAGVRSPFDAELIAREAKATSGQVTPVCFDVEDPSSIAAAVAAVKASLGGDRLFALVNSAGVATGGPLLHQPLDQVRRHFEVNVVGLVAVIQAFAPLIDQGLEGRGNGRIINLGSVTGRIAVPFLGAYSASKHAVEGLSVALRRELLHQGLHVAVIAPGAVSTPIWRKGQHVDFSYLGSTGYETRVDRVTSRFAELGERGMSPERIARVVSRALRARRPRRRYAPVAGWLRNWILPQILPAFLSDALIARHFNSPDEHDAPATKGRPGRRDSTLSSPTDLDFNSSGAPP